MPLKATRRQFLKLSGATAGCLLVPVGVGAAAAASEGATFPLHKKIVEGRTICPYCSCGCGLVIATDKFGHVLNSEGDPDNPINRGALDPKSISVRQLSTSSARLGKVQYRAAGSDKWEEKSWDWAISEIAKRMRKAREATWVSTAKSGDKEVAVNRTDGIAWLGGAANNSEEGYLASKLMRSLGVVYLEHQARI